MGCNSLSAPQPFSLGRSSSSRNHLIIMFLGGRGSCRVVTDKSKHSRYTQYGAQLLCFQSVTANEAVIPTRREPRPPEPWSMLEKRLSFISLNTGSR